VFSAHRAQIGNLVMSSDVVIRVENLAKKYTIRHFNGLSGDGLRHALQNAVTAPFKLLNQKLCPPDRSLNGNGLRASGLRSSPSKLEVPPNREAFWALKNVSFDVRRGEVIGIIGRNGAGKSTLLKILSRITEPTLGRIGIKGRVASLLEVGTGFHNELTGRENIFLNGAILGMTRMEVKRKFAEIVDFAGIENFLNTPVKRYSSGMYVRLAFAVAAHLEPEILIVDEVLAVGDADFQQKCLGKMREVASGLGRTVFFVSHQLESVLALCTRVCLFEAGHLKADGEPDAVVQIYQQRGLTVPASAGPPNATIRPGSGTVRIASLTPQRSSFKPDEPKTFHAQIVTNDSREVPFYIQLDVINQNHQIVTCIDSHHWNEIMISGAIIELFLVIQSPWLCPGEYRIDARLYNFGLIDHWEDVCRFGVSSRLPYSGSVHQPAIKASLVLAEFSLSQRIPRDP
jgi:lipopolysaccharide transport system ATP-binding protein